MLLVDCCLVAIAAAITIDATAVSSASTLSYCCMCQPPSLSPLPPLSSSLLPTPLSLL
jgi:hypothetical protein